MLCIEVREMASMTERSLLGDLRKRTGISFINCRKALEQFENDIDKVCMSSLNVHSKKRFSHFSTHSFLCFFYELPKNCFT